MGVMSEKLGEIAYNAYLDNKLKLPARTEFGEGNDKWIELHPDTRRKWIAVAEAVLAPVREQWNLSRY